MASVCILHKFCYSLESPIIFIFYKYNYVYRGNIPDGDVNRGETVFNYLQPFPAKGTGYQRMIFILYKQSTEINFSSIKSVSKK